jgi:hypothetical protein
MAPSMKKIWISHWVGPFMYMEFQKYDSFLLNFCNLIYNCCIPILGLGNVVCPPQGLVKIFFYPLTDNSKNHKGGMSNFRVVSRGIKKIVTNHYHARFMAYGAMCPQQFFLSKIFVTNISGRLEVFLD